MQHNTNKPIPQTRQRSERVEIILRRAGRGGPPELEGGEGAAGHHPPPRHHLPHHHPGSAAFSQLSPNICFSPSLKGGKGWGEGGGDKKQSGISGRIGVPSQVVTQWPGLSVALLASLPPSLFPGVLSLCPLCPSCYMVLLF